MFKLPHNGESNVNEAAHAVNSMFVEKKTMSSSQLEEQPLNSLNDAAIVKVETIIKVNNGFIEFTQEPFKIGDLQFILVPQILSPGTYL